jgi:hypothetical protein
MSQVIDYTAAYCSPAVTLDGPEPRPSDLPTRLVPSRRPAAERTDTRSELQILRSTVEGRSDKVVRLKLAVQHFLQERHEKGVI